MQVPNELSADPSKVTELKWFDIKDIPKGISSPVKKAAGDFCKLGKKQRMILC
ncbi:MAG: hypothetical protein FWE34_00115 [Defluviitaleaceae bacterium]|nr:hypothetical protein [Defluviitaleaceae bacterium]